MKMQVAHDLGTGVNVCRYMIVRHDPDQPSGLRAFSLTFVEGKSRHDIANALWYELRPAAKGLRPARR